ncbi:ArsR family transcriptional regulator [Candidatus Woesearchaeota archaeon]|jgi:predicted transcriptional regulator|nr:ArsR family transcriptional regulator [Candidatus Woesearchaeota archaeon]MBT5397102.1 ArsR family transcriptional regulator [Candidatus Woesearchaeota archaeon]MBT6367352.1 ArsR family transcriptional regulator [Candidatus Woesearchaeota archaeon]MBT7762502.1 ArsR family transcriptional regulator [Candidatus Woesearchaeota archaeon]
MASKITLVRIRRTPHENINQELQWFGNSLGLFNLRDKDSSCFRVFITLVRKAKRNETISSDDISDKLNLSRGTVVHHLTKLMNSGLVVREKGGYLLRSNNLSKVIRDIQRDVSAMFNELEDVAKEIDDKLG